MAAVIKIEVVTSGGLETVKKDISDLGREAQDAGGGFSSLREIGVGALRALGEATLNLAGTALQTLGSAIKDGIADAQKNAQIQAQTAAVIASTGKAAGITAQQVANLASNLSDASGMSLFGDDQIQESENLLLTFTNVKKESLELATAISVDMAQALGGAPKDAAIQLGKALNDPVAGITALSRVGVSFTKDQAEVIKKLQDTGDMAGAQRIILDELNKEFGGSAQAAAAATGGWSEFNGRMGEAKEAIGTAILPLLSQLASVLLTNVVPMIEDLAASFGPFIQTTIPQLIAGFNEFQTAITPIVEFIEANLRPIVAGLAAVLITVVVPAFVAWAVAAGTAALATIAALAPILIPIAAIGAAVALLVAAWDSDFMGIQTTLTTFWTTTGEPIFTAIRDWLAVNLPVAIQTLANFWTNTLQPALSAVWSFLQTYIIPIFTALVQVHMAVLGAAIRTLTNIWTTELLPALTKVWSFIQTNLGPMINWLTVTILKPLMQILADTYFTVIGSVLPAFTKLSGLVKDEVAHAFNSLNSMAGAAAGGLSKIGEAVSGVIKWISDLIAKLNSVSIPDWLQGHSPPPMADWFSYIGDAVGQLNAQLPTLSMNLAAQIGPSGGGVANTSISNRPFDFSVVNHNYGPANEPMDMHLAQALAGV